MGNNASKRQKSAKKNIFLVNFCVDDFFEGEVLQRASDKAHFQSRTNLAKTFVFHEKKFRFDFSQFNQTYFEVSSDPRVNQGYSVLNVKLDVWTGQECAYSSFPAQLLFVKYGCFCQVC